MLHELTKHGGKFFLMGNPVAATPMGGTRYASTVDEIERKAPPGVDAYRIVSSGRGHASEVIYYQVAGISGSAEPDAVGSLPDDVGKNELFLHDDDDGFSGSQDDMPKNAI